MEIAWDDDPTPTNRKRTQRILFAVAIVPWFIIIAVFLLQRESPQSPPTTLAYESLTPAPTHDLTETPPAPIDQNLPPSLTQPVAPTVPHASSERSLEAFALILAARHLRSIDAGYAFEQIVIETVDTTSPAMTIVTVLASYHAGTSIELIRLAIPIALDNGQIVATPPYLLPVEHMDIILPDLHQFGAIASHDLIADALRRAGFADPVIHSAFDAPNWPALVAVTVQQDDGMYTDMVVFLHATADGYVVAGMRHGNHTPQTLAEVLR